MQSKPKVAIYWLSGCGGCDEAIVDLNEAILKVADAIEIVLWPVAMDFKYDTIRAMDDGEITLSIINGSVRNSDHLEMAHLLRRKSQLVLAFGACACFGGTCGLANFRSKKDIFDWVYENAPTVVNPKHNVPLTESVDNGHKLTLPEFWEKVYPLNEIIDIDYYLPGCPPPPNLIAQAVFAVVEGKLPPKGTVLSPGNALCDSCPRNATKPFKLEIKEIKRIHEVESDPSRCFLAQGIICLGPAIRSGCGETCINTNVPCRGCFGPVDGIDDAGAKFLSSLAILLAAETEDAAGAIIDKLVDPSGYCYRFSLPSAQLSPKR